VTALVTGFPTSFLALRVVRRLLARSTRDVTCVVQSKSMEDAEAFVAAATPAQRARITLLEGDSASLDLGLSGAEIMALAARVEVIHHCAAVTYLGADRAIAERTNVGSAREVLELAELATKLERLVMWSTALVSGQRRGYVLEDELDPGVEFPNVVAETRMRAERMVREVMDRVPTTILRPSIVVGDSVTGEIDRLDGPYLLVRLLLNAPPDLRMPMPGRGELPLNLVPVDYVVDAGFTIAEDPRSVGKTFHLVDPDPLTARRVFELIAAAAERPVPRGFVPANLAKAVLKTPGLERYAHVPRTFLEQLATDVVYDDRNTRALLEGSGLSCPPFEDYVATLVDFVGAQQAQRRADEDDLQLSDDDLPLG